MEERLYQIGSICIRMTGCLFHENETLALFRTDKPEGTLLSYECTLADQIDLPAIPSAPARAHELFFPGEDGGLRVLLRDVTDTPLISERICGETHKISVAKEALPLWDSNLALKLWRLPDLLLQQNELFLHASMITVDGKAILFTAQKQVGKSTQAALWEQYRGAEIINGDRALLRKIDNRWYACGSPYCGTSKICKPGTFPLFAVVTLQQAPASFVRVVEPKDSARAFLDGCTFDASAAGQTEKILDAALSIYRSTAMYALYCTPDQSAVDCLAQALHL